MFFYNILLLIYVLVDISFGNPLVTSYNHTVEDVNGSEYNISGEAPECIEKILRTKDVQFLENGKLFIYAYNVTLHPTELEQFRSDQNICFLPEMQLRKQILSRCVKWVIEKDEFEKWPNGSVVRLGKHLEEGTFEFNKKGELLMCMPVYDDDYDAISDDKDVSIKAPECIKKILGTNDVQFLENGKLFIYAYNVTLQPTEIEHFRSDQNICFLPVMQLRKEILNRCVKWVIEEDEFEKWPNGSVVRLGKHLEEGTFEFNKKGELLMCMPEYDYDDVEISDGKDASINKPTSIVNEESVSISKVGSSISIIALIIHIIIFCLVPSLWNLPGYNMLALSIAFLMAYSFVLIGLIPEVLGTFCVVSAILQHYFFLAAFFCMNIMAYDVWKALKMAINDLVVRSQIIGKNRILWYSLYAWGGPLLITMSATIIDNTENAPNWVKPNYGKNDVCWMPNDTVGKAIFFTLPTLALVMINVVFFSYSAFIIKRNRTNRSNPRQSVKTNFFLYLRLAIMMGITWFFGAIAILTQNDVVWIFFEIFNALQGLFVFILFTCCSKKVYRHVMGRIKGQSSATEVNSK